MIITSSPGKVILFGEHAVVYDKLGIACTIDKRCYVKVSFSNKENISVRSIDLDLSNSFQEKQLLDLFETINKLKTNKEFQKIREIYQENRLVPVFFILGDIAKKYGFRGLEIEIKSDIPKNLGSSSAVFSAVAFGVLSLLKEDVSKKEISDFAFLGDILAHGGTPSGIDNTIVTYGGYLKYKKSQGVIPLNINFEIPLLIVDSGEEAQTGEMVSFVREEKKKNSKFVDDILHSLDIISQKALGALNSKNLFLLGKLMVEYYKELKKLKISTPKLDNIVEIALKNKALGVKPTGGWGGGCCLVLFDNKDKALKLINTFKDYGFSSFLSKSGVEGTKIIIH